MIGKIPRAGRGFTGLVSYLMHGKAGQRDQQRVEWTHTRNLVSLDPALAPTQMRATAARSTRCEKPVYHLVISWRSDERPTPAAMLQVGEATLGDLNLMDHQAVFFSHKDTDHRHLHVVVNRVHPATHKAWHASKDYERVERSLARQAKELGFLVVPGRHNSPERAPVTPKRVRDSDYQKSARQGLPRLDRWSPEEILSRQHQLGPIFEEATSWRDLTDRLSEARLRLIAKGQGVIIADDTGYMKLSELHKDIRLKGLEHRYCQSFEQFASSHDAYGATPIKNSVDHQFPDATTTLGPDYLEPEVEVLSGNPATDDANSDPAEPAIPRAPRDPERARPQAVQANSSAEADDALPSPVVTPAREEHREVPTSIEAAFAHLQAARHTLDLAYALGSLVSSTSLSRAHEDVRRAEQELRAHQNVRDILDNDISDALAKLVEPDEPEPEQEDDEEMSR